MNEKEVVTSEVNPAQLPTEHHDDGPRPIGTLMVVAILLLVTIAFWMLVLGIQQARA